MGTAWTEGLTIPFDCACMRTLVGALLANSALVGVGEGVGGAFVLDSELVASVGRRAPHSRDAEFIFQSSLARSYTHDLSTLVDLAKQSCLAWLISSA